MFASTNVFTASPLSPGFESDVARLNVKPATPTETDACSVVAPGEVELTVTVHSPLVPAVVQLFAPSVPLPPTVVKLTTVPAGAVAGPEPAFTFTCAVEGGGGPPPLVPGPRGRREFAPAAPTGPPSP